VSHIHVPDGVLPLWLWGSGWLLTLLLVAAAGKVAERAEVRRKVPLLAAISALMLVAMSSEILPLAYHINLTVVGGVLLGPVLSVIAAFIIEVVLAMLGHGGITVLGLNALIVMAEMVAGWALFRGLVRILGRRHPRAAAMIATPLTLAFATTLLVGVVALSSGSATARAAGWSVTRFAAVVYALGPIGWFVEALVTAGLLGYIARVRPGLLWEGALAETEPRLPAHEHGTA
jgi:cobalt/nickel transport system permease protein